MSLTPDEFRIRQALEQIETPMYDIAGAVWEQRARRGRRQPLYSPRRIIPIAAAVIVLLTMTAAAVTHLSGGWEALFGRGVILPEDLAVPLQAGQTIDGYTLTLDDAIVTEKGVAVMYSLRREDGQPLDGMVSLLESVTLQRDGLMTGTGGRGEGTFEEGGRVQYCYQEFDMAKDPGDCELTLTVGPAVRSVAGDTLTVDTDLAALYRDYPAALPAAEEETLSGADYPPVADILPRSEQNPEIAFAGAALEDGTLCLLLRTPGYDREEGVSAEIVSLLDARTGEAEYSDEMREYTLPGSSGILQGSYFSDMTEDDLPYLRMQVVYTERSLLTDEPWEFTFRAKSEEAYDSGLDLDLEEGMSVNHITVSPLGVNLKGSRPVTEEDEWPFSDRLPEVAVLLENGSAIGAHSSSSGSTRGEGAATETFHAFYEYQSGAYSRSFLNMEDVAAVRIDGKTIPIEK